LPTNFHSFLTFSGNGGEECLDHVTLQRRIVETAFGASIAVVALIVGAKLQPNKRGKQIAEVNK
jgi:hypothetical protein